MNEPGKKCFWSVFFKTQMGCFLFINSFSAFSILSLKAAVSLSHLPVTSDFHLFVLQIGMGRYESKAHGTVLIWNVSVCSFADLSGELQKQSTS